LFTDAVVLKTLKAKLSSVADSGDDIKGVAVSRVHGIRLAF